MEIPSRTIKAHPDRKYEIIKAVPGLSPGNLTSAGGAGGPTITGPFPWPPEVLPGGFRFSPGGGGISPGWGK